jgi:spore maturation protein CgeB
VHYMPYANAADCRRLLGKLCQRPAQTWAIAADGHREVMRHHTYCARAQSILDSVSR